MDPLAAFGLASNILAFVEFGGKVLKTAKHIHESQTGALNDDTGLEAMIRQMQRHHSDMKLLTPDSSHFIGGDKEMCLLADECGRLAKELLDLLESIRPQSRSSKRQALKAAMKNVRHTKDKEKLEARLNSCRAQFEAQVMFMASEENRVRLLNLADQAKNDNEKLRLIETSITNLKGELEATFLSEKARDQLNLLLDVPEAVLKEVATERVLSGLRFDNMNERINTIAEPSSRTFDWITNDQYRSPRFHISQDGNSATSESERSSDIFRQPDLRNKFRLDAEDNGRQQSRELLFEWLSSGKGVMHISAKLGAGKSTLMKKLCEPRGPSFDRLREWAGNQKLVVGKFFFWNSGTRLQKSIAGLCRSILYDVLQSNPELLPHVMPLHWNTASASSWQVQKMVLLSDADCVEALKRLARSAGLSPSYRFCFFIDGLDELDETTQYTYWDLAHFVQDIAVSSQGNVKICVSSREYKQFTETFPHDLRIRLHDLTKQDMLSYAQQQLSKVSDAPARKKLIISIVERAQGIFLWVSVVIRNISALDDSSFSYDRLLKEVNELPEELDELFAHLLKSLKSPIRQEAYKLFAMVLEASRWKLNVTTLSYNYLEQYEKAPHPTFWISHPVSSSESDSEMSSNGQKKAIGCSRGLVEVVAAKTGCGLSKHETLTFVHRSVKDFLLRPEIKSNMVSHLKDFDVREVLCQTSCIVLRIWGQLPSYTVWDCSVNQWQSRYMRILKMRAAMKMDTEPFLFLTSIEKWRLEMDVFPPSQPEGKTIEDRVHVIEVFHPEIEFNRCFSRYLVSERNTLKPKEWRSVVNSPACMLTQSGGSAFPLWWIRQLPGTVQSEEQVHLLICCAIERHLIYRSSRQRNGGGIGPRLIKILLERGLVSPNSPMKFLPSRVGTFSDERLNFHVTVLQACFLAAAYSVLHAKGKNPELNWFGAILEELLRHNADIDFTISAWIAEAEPSGKWGHHDEFEYTIQISSIVDDSNYKFTDNFLFGGCSKIPKGFSNIKPRGFVEIHEVYNKSCILQLLDNQAARVKQSADWNSCVESEHSPWYRAADQVHNGLDTRENHQLTLEASPNSVLSNQNANKNVVAHVILLMLSAFLMSVLALVV